jgi:predicted transposase/invertase (TIGR01784 family)
LKEKIFLKLFETAEIAKLKPEEYKQYEASVNAYRDILNIKNTYLEKGKMERNIEIARNMLSKGMEVSVIGEITGLTKKEIEKLRR